MPDRPCPPGFSRADLHVHTTYSDGTATPEDVLNYYALSSQISVFAITDHDTLDGALRARRFADEHPDLFGHLDVIVGEEVSTRDGHVLGLFLAEWIPPGLSAAETVEQIHAQGGVAIAAHPYTNWMRFAGLEGVGDLIRSLPFDAVETRNANFTEVFANRRAESNAGDKARVGCSDGHFLDAVGRCYTEFAGEGARDLRRAIKERSTRPGGSCYGVPTLARFVLQRLRTRQWVVPRRDRFRKETQRGSLEIRVANDSGVHAAVLSLRGRLDEATMGELKDTLTHLGRARIGMVIELSGVEFMGSAGVTALIAGMKAARHHGVGFAIASPSRQCRETLDTAGLVRAFRSFADPEAARRHVADQAEPLVPG